MWIFALEGFVSIVAVRGRTDRLMIRGRLREDVKHWSDGTPKTNGHARTA